MKSLKRSKIISAKLNPNTLIHRNPSNYNTKLFYNGWRFKQAIILTEFNQRARYAIFKSVFRIFGLDAKRSSSDEFLEIKQVSFQSQLIKEFGFKMKPIDLKEQELINLFNLKFGHFSWENYLA
ncbi:hypothetical protein UBN86_05880 [Helicobacter pylori]